MKIKKFIVFCFVMSVSSFRVRYCGICNNHTLCKYSVEGPSAKCVNYDKTSQLTKEDVVGIVNRINERRHLVTMGLLNNFPQAANMKKMRWSTKLASFAQRWADQCDRSVKPNKEDECRDLVSMKVGQSIATVLGPSPGLNVKSFVDIWFMLNLHFIGNVAYYNQSKDSKTTYFTQLIWADTAFVGCGRAKFFVDDLNTIVERLVCDFAPKGNIHGKPIYTIGYPGTQCPKQMIPDTEFPGLCFQTMEQATNFVETSSPSSLLRILNLSNNSLKQELDPNNQKQMHLNSSESHVQRNQKTRNVYPNNSYGAMKRDSVHFQNPIRNNMENFNDPHFTQRQYTPERGHSRMYHGHQSSKEPMYNLDNMGHVHTETDFRRTDFTTSAPFYSISIQDARKHYVDSPPCTRKMSEHNCFSSYPPCKSKTNDCMRGQSHNNCQQTHANSCQHTELPRHEKQCPCNEPPPPAPCHCNQKCAPTSNCPPFTTYCPYGRRVGGDDDKFNQFENYDLFHNLEVKSGEDNLALKKPWHFENPNADKSDKTEYSRRESDSHRQVKTMVNELIPKPKTLQDSYGSFDYSERKKRDLEDQTFKPFWQMDEYNQKKPAELKSIKYTTLSNKKLRKTRKTAPSMKLLTITETITIKPKDKSSVHFGHRGRVTEKYLSFDELMHLRKLSTAASLAEPIENDARRKADEDSKDSTTTTITANTPFMRQKYCTRKLTCTWTAAMNGAGGGGAGSGGGGGGGYPGFDTGSRTPPGYVDGCTRTSTCTRDHMERNKFATLSEGPSDGTSSGDSEAEDEDYCERRSLNIRRRNLDANAVTISGIGFQEAHTIHPFSTTSTKVLTTKSEEIVTSLKTEDDKTDSQNDNFHCVCYDEVARVKRGELNNFDQVLNKDCDGVKNYKKIKYKHVPSHNNDDYTYENSRSKNSLTSFRYLSNGTKPVWNMFYASITLKYCLTWILIYTTCFL